MQHLETKEVLNETQHGFRKEEVVKHNEALQLMISLELLIRVFNQIQYF